MGSTPPIKQFWPASLSGRPSECSLCKHSTHAVLFPKFILYESWKYLFSGMVNEHQHPLIFVNFKTVCQPQCTSNSSLMVYQEGVQNVHYANIEHMLNYSQSPSCIHQNSLLAGMASEKQYLASLINFKTV